ncbi:MAG: hypothetical protein U0354_15080 [Candidatus Sericytochromatia bacterium]
MLKILLNSALTVLLFTSLSFNAYAFSKQELVSPEDIIRPEQQANYFEKYLGVMEVGKTKKSLLELYIGEGYSIKQSTGEKVYYLDKKNNKTLIIETNHQGIIEIATYKNGLELPPNVKNIDEIKVSKRMNLKNLMTSMGSRMGYNPYRIMGAYGRPSVEIKDKDTREFKYIMLGNLNKKIDFVYLEYSFVFQKNKVVEIRIENGK